VNTSFYSEADPTISEIQNIKYNVTTSTYLGTDVRLDRQDEEIGIMFERMASIFTTRGVQKGRTQIKRYNERQ